MADEEKKYSGYGYHGGGRKKGSGKGTTRISFSVSCQPEDVEQLKALAQKSGKTLRRVLVELALQKEN